MPSKRYRKALELVDAKKIYPLKPAVEVLAKFPKAKFNETVDLAFRLGVDPKQSDQMVRGTVPLPHGSGKTVQRAGVRQERRGRRCRQGGWRGVRRLRRHDQEVQEGWTISMSPSPRRKRWPKSASSAKFSDRAA